MKRYLLFGGDGYYPLGGFGDFIQSFDTKDLAIEHINLGGQSMLDEIASSSKYWFQIVDGTTGEIVWNK